MDGGPDEESGHTDAGGWFGKMHGPFLLAALESPECVEILEEYGDEDSLATLATAVGCILSEDSNGFVHAEFYYDPDPPHRKARFEDDWAEVLEANADIEED